MSTFSPTSRAARCAVAAILATFAVAGCNNGANNDVNYKTAINDHFKAFPACIWSQPKKFPVQAATSDDVKTVDTKVVGVRTDLDATTNDLKMARSEMGTLIAKNHDEIDALRRLGERDYVEFTIAGKNKPQKVGSVTVELKGVNEKRNQYSVAMTVEDKRFDKKNRALNEPIFFYTSGTKIPDEIVINKVGKDTISGYISVPKANAAAQNTSASGR